jgi:hypothetical protein
MGASKRSTQKGVLRNEGADTNVPQNEVNRNVCSETKYTKRCAPKSGAQISPEMMQTKMCAQK